MPADAPPITKAAGIGLQVVGYLVAILAAGQVVDSFSPFNLGSIVLAGLWLWLGIWCIRSGRGRRFKASQSSSASSR
jgi:hypothetical protein